MSRSNVFVRFFSSLTGIARNRNKGLPILLTTTFIVSGFFVFASITHATAPSISTYTIDNPVISPNSDGVKDSASIDLKFSEPVKADVNILNSSGTKVRDLYYSSEVTNPDPKIWDGKNNNSNTVNDGIYTVKITITDKAENSTTDTTTDTSKTITVDNTVPKTTLTVSPAMPDGNSEWYKTQPVTTFTCDDSNSNIVVSECDKIYYKWDDATDYSEYSNSLTAPNGDHTLSYYSTDKAGNRELTNTKEFKVDTNGFGYSTKTETGTYIFGEIAKNMTWTIADSPYIIVGEVIVSEGKTLTIDPGVEIKFDGYYGLDVKGTLNAIGEKENYITFTSNRDNPYVGSWKGIKLEEGTSTNNKIQYAIIEYASDGIYSDWNSRGSVILKNSILRKLDSAVRELKDSEISYNDFLNINYVFSSLSGSTAITHNYISGYQTVFSYLNNSSLVIEYNNIDIGATNTWFIKYSNAKFENNYWGTTDKNYIQKHIDSSSSNADFEPYAKSFITFDLTRPEDDTLFTSSPSSIELQWNPINGSGKDLDHYELYIDGTSTATTTDTSYSYNISQLSDGFHQWHVKAVNKDNNSTFPSNNILGFNVNYKQPHTPIATISSGECNDIEIEGITWCYNDIEVTISAENSDFITYTLDGNEPTSSSSTYSTSIPISILDTATPTILKAKSWKKGTNSDIGSPLMTEKYNFDLTPPAKPVANPTGGVYKRKASVELSSEGSAEIRYTTDNTDPTKLSDKYTSPVQINGSTVLKAKAWDEHGNNSEIMKENYFITDANGNYDQFQYNANLRASLEEGTYIFPSDPPTEITLSANEETDVIRYTLDGSEVSDTSTEYTNPITISTGTTTLKARAWSQNGAISYQTINNKYIIYDHGTYITDNINMNTNWDTSGSPYVVKRNTQISINKKLTIEPGVEIILNQNSELYAGGYGYGGGQIEAIGTKENPVVISSGYLSYYGGNVRAQNNNKLEYVKFDNVNLSLDNSTVSNSIFDNSELRANSSKIENNKFVSMERINFWDSEINIGNNTTFSNNYIEIAKLRENMQIPEQSISAMFRVGGSNVLIERNEFVKGENSSDIPLFDIINNSNVDINKNNFNFTLPDNILLMRNNSGMKIDMRNNYWGTLDDENYIQSHIYDSKDDDSLGEIYYKPYAPSSLSFDLIYPNEHTLNGKSAIEFQWEPFTGDGENLDHYNLYIASSSETIWSTTTTTKEITYSYSGALEDGNYTWYVEAVKTDGSSTESNQRFNFIIDSAVDKVIAQPNGGAYITLQTVNLSYPVENAIIRYTLDGREPTEISAIYTGPIGIDGPGITTLKAKAWYNSTSSDVMTEEYTIDTTPPEITTSTSILAKEDVSYGAGTLENALQGIIGEVAPEQRQAIGLYIETNKPATCKYSSTDKNFASIEGNWYNHKEGIFRSAHGTAEKLIAPLGNLPIGEYKYFVICSDGVDETKTTIEFVRKDDSIKIGPILSTEDIYYAKTIAQTDNAWENGWQWIFNITVPENETKLRMKFRNWQKMDTIINVNDNMRYYSPQATTSTDPDNAILITASQKYPETPIVLDKDINQDKPGRQIQIIVEMKIPEGTPSGVYLTKYGIQTF